MLNIFEIILQNIDKATAVILALAGLITTIVIQYRKIVKLLAMKELEELTAPIAAIAETKPQEVLASIIDKPLHLDSSAGLVSIGTIQSNLSKAEIVGTAAYEKAKAEKPNILKRLGIKSAADMIPIVSTVYQSIVKPILKRS